MDRTTYDHPAFGTVSLQNGWVPAPGYVLRRHRVLKTLAGLPRGKLIDVGCGAGALVRDLQGMGFACTGLETGPGAHEIARRICADRAGLEIYSAAQNWSREFDYVVSFEVLEHIEDDADALRQWMGWLRPGGRVLISVPAGPERWNASDVWAGHYRRYTRESLGRLLSEAGLVIDTFQTYGFPLANVLEPIRAMHHARQLRRRGTAADDKHESSAQSGVERGLEARVFPLQSSWLGVQALRICCELQELFASTDLGTGFFVTARER
jgi:SAM-dependent methyltransferase